MSQPTPFDGILDQSRDLCRDKLVEALSAILDKADEGLTAIVDKTEDKDAQAPFVAARDVVSRQRADLQSEFENGFLEEFQKRVKKVRKSLKTDADEGEDFELELVGEEDLNETLKFNEFAAKMRNACDSELGALDQRAAVMLGDADLQSDDNPFGPKTICEAIKQAYRSVNPEVGVRIALLRIFDGHLKDIRDVYGEVNELLIENSILPKIKFKARKTAEGKAPGAAGEEEMEEEEDEEEDGDKKPGGKKAAAAPDDFFAALTKLMPAAAVAAPGSPGTPGGPPALQGVELLNSLSKLQLGDLSALTSGTLSIQPGQDLGATNVLKEIKATNVGQSLGSMDAMTLDIVSMLFDQLFDDPKIPSGVKALAGRLQLPMLKVAIADKTLFSSREHPARVHLDILGEFAVRLPHDFDDKHPLWPKLEPIEHEIVEKFQDKVDVFITGNEKLRALIAEEDRRAAVITNVEAKRLEQLENLSVGRSAAQEEIKTRLRERHPAKPAREFLVHQWIKVLLVAHTQGGKDGAPWKESLETMDTLLWSVEPKPTKEEQRKLATSVPSLLKRLTAGLNSVGVDAAVRTGFYSELMKLHTAVMSLDAKPKPGADPTSTATKSPLDPASTATKSPAGVSATGTKLPLAPGAKPVPGAKPAAPPPKAVEDDLDFTAEITVNVGGSEVKVDELDFTDAAPALAPAAAAGPIKAGVDPKAAPGGLVAGKKPAKDFALPSKLKEGSWVGIRPVSQNPDEPRQPAKLFYMSPLKSRFLFCDRAGKTVLECNRGDLARRFKMRELILLSESPDTSFFDRILRGVMGKLGSAPA